MKKNTPKELQEKADAFERYSEARGYGPVYLNSKVTLITKPAADRPGTEKKVKQKKSRPGYETAIEWKQRAMQQYRLKPLAESTVLDDYNVTNPARYQRPPPMMTNAKPLAWNVQHKKNADDIDEQSITASDFRNWRESLGMTQEQVAAILRVTSRTIRGWEFGRNRIPFMVYWAMQYIKPSELPPATFKPSKPTRYYKPEIQDAGNLALKNVLQRYSCAMKPTGITASAFKQWRLDFMLMTPDQLGQLLRLPALTINKWEKGESPIPFTVWWVMHCTLQDPEYFLTRPGFHDFYIEYEAGEAKLCSRRYPDIRVTTTDLYLARSALQSVAELNQIIRDRDERIGQLQAENTNLRKMMKAGTVTSELKAMHAHIGELMKQIHTADVVEFPEQIEFAEVVPLRQAKA